MITSAISKGLIYPKKCINKGNDPILHNLKSHNTGLSKPHSHGLLYEIL